MFVLEKTQKMAEYKTDEEVMKLLVLAENSEHHFPETDWMTYDGDYNMTVDCTFEGVQSVPDLASTPFLNQPNYPTIEAAPMWLSENFHNDGNLKLSGASGDAQPVLGKTPEYSPAPSTTSSFFGFNDPDEKPRENYNQLLTSLEITEKQLQKFTVKELNRFLKSKGLSKGEQQRVKNRRRTLKNRGYAQNCRVKRINQKKSLEEQNEELFKELEQLKVDYQKAQKERNYYKNKFELLARFVKEHRKRVA